MSAAELMGGVFHPGCMICSNIIPERPAKMRSKTCSNECRNMLRRLRAHTALFLNTPVFCQACRKEIPKEIAKRFGMACSTQCRNELRRYRWQVVKNTKCPHCYHPSSPAEWENYRRWRASQGTPMQSFIETPTRGNLAVRREKRLREALADAIGALEDKRDEFIAQHCGDNMEGRQAIADASQYTYVMNERLARLRGILNAPRNAIDGKAAE